MTRGLGCFALLFVLTSCGTAPPAGTRPVPLAAMQTCRMERKPTTRAEPWRASSRLSV